VHYLSVRALGAGFGRAEAVALAAMRVVVKQGWYGLRVLDAPISLDVEPSDTVQSVKSRVLDSQGIPSHVLSVMFSGSVSGSGRQLNDRGSLADEHVEDGATLMLVRPTTFVIFVKMLDGKTVEIHPDADDRVWSVRLMLYKLCGIPPQAQRLVWCGKQLVSNRKLSDYGISIYSTLHLVMRLIPAEIWVVPENGDEHLFLRLRIGDVTTVADLKRYVADHHDIEPARQLVKHDGTVLQDDTALFMPPIFSSVHQIGGSVDLEITAAAAGGAGGRGPVPDGVRWVLGKPTQVAWAKIVAGTNNFATQLGELGGFGAVFTGRIGGVDVAVKRMDQDEDLGIAAGMPGLVQLRNELAALSKFKGPHLVPLLGFHIPAADGDGKPCIVYAKMGGGDLASHVWPKAGEAPMPWWRRLDALIDMANGLRMLHTSDDANIVAHMDVKSTNVLVDDDGRCRLGDFGICGTLERVRVVLAGGRIKTVSKRRDSPIGTIGYMSPEYLRAGRMSVKCDVYAFGVVMAELLTGRHANPGDGELLVEVLEDVGGDADALADLVDATAAWPAPCAVALWPIVFACLQHRRVDRAEMTDVLVRLEEVRRSFPRA